MNQRWHCAQSRWLPNLPVSLRRFWEPVLAVIAFGTMMTCAHWGASQKSVSGQPVSAVAAQPTSALTLSTIAANTERSPEGDAPIGRVSERIGPSGANTSKLVLWSEATQAYRSSQRKEPLRILWFGDSHAAADYWPGAVRNTLSRVIALAGPGYLSLGVPNYRHSMVRLWREGSMELAPHPAARRSVEDDGVFGLGGTRVTLKDSTASVSLKPTFEGSASTMINYELYYRASATDRLMLTVGSEKRVFGKEGASASVGGLLTVRFEASGKSTVEVRALSGVPQLFGIVAETKTSGLVIDTLGINGARYGTVLSWDKESFTAVVAARKPLVAVVAYGTNEVFDEEAVSRHATRLEQVLERLRLATPEIGCIVAGPTDVSKGGEATAARVVALDQAERITAERLGCVYFSAYDEMASDGGYAAWSRQDPPLALSDGIHLTARGYARLGEALARKCLIPTEE